MNSADSDSVPTASKFLDVANGAVEATTNVEATRQQKTCEQSGAPGRGASPGVAHPRTISVTRLAGSFRIPVSGGDRCGNREPCTPPSASKEVCKRLSGSHASPVGTASPGEVDSSTSSPRKRLAGSCTIPVYDRHAASEEAADVTTSPVASKEASRRLSQGATSSTLAKLLELWKNTRNSSEPLSGEERQAILAVLFESMSSERVAVVNVRRIAHSEMMTTFCQEEDYSLDQEERNIKKHKEFMFLHGTRWEFAPLICQNGLDPECGHLARGTWLGQSAVSAHSYAAKGPGPESELAEGHRLFTMFAVACVPNHFDGDGERSFGVWRIMAQKRMYPAYQIVYSAPMDMRSKQHLVLHRVPKGVLPQSRSVEALSLEHVQKEEFTSAARAKSPVRCRSVSPPRVSFGAKAPPVVDVRVHEKVQASSGSSSCSTSATSTTEENCRRPPSVTPLRVYRRRSDVGGYSLGCSKVDSKVLSRPADVSKREEPCKREDVVKREEDIAKRDDLIPRPPRSSIVGKREYTQKKEDSTSKREDAGSKTEEKRADSKVFGPKSTPRIPRNMASTANSDWEVLIDEGWIPFKTSSKFRDQPGTEQQVCLGQFWYCLTFDSDGNTGTQKNLCTGKTRPLRRVVPSSETCALSEPSTDALSEQCADSQSSTSCPQGSVPSQVTSFMSMSLPVSRVAGARLVTQDPAMNHPCGSAAIVTPLHGYPTVQRTPGTISGADHRYFPTNMPAACVSTYYHPQSIRPVPDPAMATRAHFVTRS